MLYPTARIEQEGDRVFKEFLEPVGGWPVANPEWKEDNWKLEAVLAELRKRYRQKILVRSEVGPDDKNSSVYVLQIDQGDLGMPGREYYLETNSTQRRVFDAYYNYMVELAVLMGAQIETAKREMNDVVMFEKALAEVKNLNFFINRLFA